MSYKISYGTKYQKTNYKTRSWKVVFALVVIGLTASARLCFPEEMEQLTHALFPLTSESSQNALECFAQNIKSGGNLGDAVAAFCQEIIDADNS